MFKKIRNLKSDNIYQNVPENVPVEKMEALEKLIKERNALPDGFYHMTTEDNSVELSYVNIDTLKLTKTGYKKYEKLCNTAYHTKNLYVYLSYDVSGYNYWSECQEESNYIIVNVQYKNAECELTTEDVDDLYSILVEIDRTYDVIEANHTKAKFLKELE